MFQLDIQSSNLFKTQKLYVEGFIVLQYNDIDVFNKDPQISHKL